jgi:C-terminal processing protease CtpA/Prc
MILPILVTATLLYGHISSGWGRVGIQVEYSSTTYCTITKVFNISPANEAGLIKGDKIIAVDDIPFRLKNPDCEIKGEISSVVKITIERGRGSDKKILSFLMMRVPENEVHN